MKMYVKSAVNFRQWYSIASAKIEELPAGTEVESVSIPVRYNDGHNWQFVVYNNNYGWIANEFLLVGGETGQLPIPPPPIYVPPSPPVPSGSRSIWGINIDPRNPTGNPPAGLLKGVTYVRFVFKMSAAYATLAQALNFYDVIIQAYAAQGTRVVLIINQESITENMPWGGNGHTWDDYVPTFTGLLRQLVSRYGSKVYAYEIWNEQDISADTSMYIPPQFYGNLVRESVNAVSHVSKVITGGLASGNPISYLKACGDLSSVDGIGVHPYGKGVTNIFGTSDFGRMSDYLSAIHTVFPSKLLWITEYGIARVNVGDTSLWPKIAQYMKETFAMLKKRTDVGSAIWFAWSDPMDNAGVVTKDQVPKGDIYTQFVANIRLDA